ncbi:uncharacterized protein ATNIH1004_011713 [Aspergillus tanneri]|uniref:Uncharacterized protein n=1 Tax=Aspergillus tanneri TaxID=1220188 RepID=A0A5M9MF20_9EURO|nr:uncharacterized protein ATNIH1004_011713 [Aspergillus tanneri]KAA8641577.1 hypothetical protein ATNIH1004_011713 [Aspergillus tanneri]
MSIERLSKVVEAIEAEPTHMRLLRILNQQLEYLVHDRPRMSEFYEDLKNDSLLPENEIPLPEGTLDAALDDLIRSVKENVFQQTTIRGNESISVNGSVEITCDMFQQLRPGTWLDSLTIAAAMHLSDKPAYVKHGLSVLLDEVGPDGQPYRLGCGNLSLYFTEQEGGNAGGA